MLITDLKQLRNRRKVHEVDIGEGDAVRMFSPFVADLERMQSLDDDNLVGFCDELARLIVGEGDKLLFADGGELRENLDADALSAIGDWLGKFGDNSAVQAKNSSKRAAKKRKKAKKSSKRGSR